MKTILVMIYVVGAMIEVGYRGWLGITDPLTVTGNAPTIPWLIPVSWFMFVTGVAGLFWLIYAHRTRTLKEAWNSFA